MENPKLFISYSWSSPEHEQWVLNLATELRENGVDVILDKWDLKEGQDSDAFMEKMVTDEGVKKVAMICDKTYATKADKREGGVGTEAQIISRKIYERTDQNKFVAVVAEKDDNDKAYLPTYYRSRIYIDLSDRNLYTKNFDQLLRWVFDKPLYQKPDVGKTPSFLDETKSPSLNTTTAFRRLINAIKNGEEHARGALDEFYDLFAANLENFRIDKVEGEYDELVLENIKSFLPYRDQVVEVFLTIAQYNSMEGAINQTHSFFEKLIPYLTKREHVTKWNDWDFDNFRIIVHELFLYCIAAFIKKDYVNGARYMLNQRYFFDDLSRDDNRMRRMTIFSPYIKSLEYRNNRLKLNRLSLHADVIKDRAYGVLGINFADIMQADFIIYVCDLLGRLNQKENDKDFSEWWPMTLVYAEYRSRPFEVFARAQQKEYFDKLKRILGIQNKANIDDLVTAIRAGSIQTVRIRGWGRFDLVSLMNYTSLATI
ncbi:MAG: TIR domain-containing protein [Anaerolineales bacterium]|nr:TIR domain-containing protein [Anaerolineales bacterium]